MLKEYFKEDGEILKIVEHIEEYASGAIESLSERYPTREQEEDKEYDLSEFEEALGERDIFEDVADQNN